MIDEIDISKDQLLECLILFTKLYHKPYTAESLVADLPLKLGEKTPELFSPNESKGLFSRAARNAGLKSRIAKKSLDEISPLVLPAILVLKAKRACILEALDLENRKAKIILPEMGESWSWVDLDDLAKEYIGYAFYLKKEYLPEGQKQKTTHHTTGHWFWGTLWMSRTIYRDVILASIIINIALVASPLFTMNVYDRVIPNDALDTMWVLASGIAIVYLLDLVMKFIRSYYLELAAKKSDIIMSSILFERVLDIKMSVKPKSVGSFANNLRDFDSIRNFISSVTLTTIIDMPFFILFLTVIWMLGGTIVLIPIITAALILIYALSLRKTLYKGIEDTQRASANKNRVLIESLMNMETIKSMGANGHAQWEWEEANGYIANASLKNKLLSASIPTVSNFLIQMSTVAIIIAGVYMIGERLFTMGALIAIVILSSRAMAPMGQVAGLIANYQNAKSAFNTLNEIMQMPSEHQSGNEYLKRSSFTGNIEFNNLSFKYPDEDKYSLKNISFKIEAGEKVGIVGRIGSGKTTIEKMILGLYAPTDGEIRIDGIDIGQIDPVDLRKNIGYVPQDISLMKGTLRENLIYRKPTANELMILRAANIAGVEGFVNRHPRGFDMSVGERGESISGGQRQSIAIARAVISDAPIMLFDEPTNMMDSITENEVKRKLKESMEEKTLILITHKTSLLELVDRIIVLEDGKVVADGKRDAVLAKLSGEKR